MTLLIMAVYIFIGKSRQIIHKTNVNDLNVDDFNVGDLNVDDLNVDDLDVDDFKVDDLNVDELNVDELNVDDPPSHLLDVKLFIIVLYSYNIVVRLNSGSAYAHIAIDAVRRWDYVAVTYNHLDRDAKVWQIMHS